MVAPKAPGHTVRSTYSQGGGGVDGEEESGVLVEGSSNVPRRKTGCGRRRSHRLGSRSRLHRLPVM